MAGQVHFYVNRMHAIGGVTTWSFQAASFLASRYEARVVAFNQNELEPPDQHLFPGPAMQVWAHPEWRSTSNAGQPAGGKERKEVKPERPTLPVKPTRPVKPARPARDGGDARGLLHGSAEEAIEQAALFIPNYLDFAYQLAAISRSRGIASRCLGICHLDHEHYYRLLRQYAPIILSFIAVSRRCTQKLIEYFPERAADVHFVPYGVSPPSGSPPVRRAGPIRLLYAGRLTRKQKRIFDLVEIVRELENRRIDYLLDIIGVGPDRELLVAAFMGAPRVRLYPGVSHPEMGRVYHDYDVYLLPSETEGTSIALLESMAHGLVPVATRVSGSEDVIVNGWNGFLCEVADVRSMVECIATLAGNEQLRT